MATQNTPSPDSVLIPPLATNLNDPQNTVQTAKEWYLYWKRSGDRINTLNGMVAYGNAADRLLPSQAPDGAIYVEEDRGGIIYQNQGGEWHYIAGTMWAMLNPDQRPKGLGANDAGFTFRTTDTDPKYAGRTFVWSGTVWVETTAARFDTHANRLAATNEMNGQLWVETDRSEVVYQLQGTTWHYLAGTMWGTVSPDQRPTDLGANDAGFHFRGTDQPKEFIWSGTIWVNTSGESLAAKSTGSMTLTTVMQDIPGASITLGEKGVYWIVGFFDFNLVGNDAGQTFAGGVNAGGVQLAALAAYTPTNSPGNSASRATVGQQWVYASPGPGTIVKLQAYKGGGAGSSQTLDQCTIVASWISP